MTKTSRQRRQRERRAAERAELLELRELRDRVNYGGVNVQDIAFSEVMHAKLVTADKLGHKLILRYSGNQTWRAMAVKT